MGNNLTLESLGVYDVTATVGSHRLPHTCLILKTDAFHCILGMDFINSNLCIKSSEFSPHRLVIENALGQLENAALTE